MTPENRPKTGVVDAGKNTRFQPGVSGNPGGRPATKILTDALKKRLAMRAPREFAISLGITEDITIAEAIAAELANKAMAGDIAACKEVFDRLEGKVRPSPPGPQEAVQIRVVYDQPPNSLQQPDLDVKEG